MCRMVFSSSHETFKRKTSAKIHLILGLVFRSMLPRRVSARRLTNFSCSAFSATAASAAAAALRTFTAVGRSARGSLRGVMLAKSESRRTRPTLKYAAHARTLNHGPVTVRTNMHFHETKKKINIFINMIIIIIKVICCPGDLLPLPLPRPFVSFFALRRHTRKHYPYRIARYRTASHGIERTSFGAPLSSNLRGYFMLPFRFSILLL